MHERRFSPSQAHKLDAPDRKLWLPIEPILDVLKLRPGWTVADIGAGTGYFSLRIAESVGEGGEVFAVDVEPEMLARIQTKLTESNILNGQCVQGEASATTLVTAFCDLVFMANVWHEFDDQGAVLAEVTRILKPAGQVAILDWSPEAEPPPGPPTTHRISQEAVSESLTAAGFQILSSRRAGSFTYLVLASRVVLA